MNLDRINSQIDVEQYSLVKKIPRLESFLGKWDLFKSCYYFTLVFGLFWIFWLIAVIDSLGLSGRLIKRKNSDFLKKCINKGLGIFAIFWILPLTLSLAGIFFGMRKNNRSYMVPGVSIVFVSFFIGVLVFIIEFAMLCIMT